MIKAKQCNIVAQIDEKEDCYESSGRSLFGLRSVARGRHELCDVIEKVRMNALIENSTAIGVWKLEKSVLGTDASGEYAAAIGGAQRGAVREAQPERIVDEAPRGFRSDMRCKLRIHRRGIEANDELCTIDRGAKRVLQQRATRADNGTGLKSLLGDGVATGQHCFPACGSDAGRRVMHELQKLRIVARQNETTIVKKTT